MRLFAGKYFYKQTLGNEEGTVNNVWMKPKEDIINNLGKLNSSIGILAFIIGSVLFVGVAWAGDMDGDGIEDMIEDMIDNCPYVHNPMQLDMDYDFIGDAGGAPGVAIASTTAPDSTEPGAIFSVLFPTDTSRADPV